MHIFWSLFVGLVVGGLAKLIMPGKDPGGIIITMLLGIAGAVVAGFLGSALGIYRVGAAGPGILASIAGAVLVLGAYRATFRRKMI